MTFPTDDVELTTILVVSDVDRARDFWRDVVGAEVYREYGGARGCCAGRNWILLVTGGGRRRQPEVTFAVAEDPNRVDHAFTMRVADCHAAYDTLRGRGATFLTPPVSSPCGETRPPSAIRMATCSRSARHAPGLATALSR